MTQLAYLELSDPQYLGMTTEQYLDWVSTISEIGPGPGGPDFPPTPGEPRGRWARFLVQRMRVTRRVPKQTETAMPGGFDEFTSDGVYPCAMRSDSSSEALRLGRELGERTGSVVWREIDAPGLGLALHDVLTISNRDGSTLGRWDVMGVEHSVANRSGFASRVGRLQVARVLRRDSGL